MDEKFVKINFDVSCKWEGFPPEYRIFVNGELFCERKYIYTDDKFIREMLQVKAVPGVYEVKFEHLGPKLGQFNVSELQVQGDARILPDNKFEIL